MQKSQINPACLQQMLDSAANAADKGQSQFFTPIDFGRRLCAALPKIRPTLVDLNCGNGQLLQASADNKTTARLLGADIDPCKCLTSDGGASVSTRNSKPQTRNLPVSKITSDVTRLYPLLKEISFTADCFVLNPPWRLFWYRDRLQDLANSSLTHVRQAFHGIEPGAPKGTIDSTIATLLMALDLTSAYGEGFLIANNNTLERLLFGAEAPHAAAARHVWLRLIVPGNPMTGIDGCQWKEDGDFQTGIIYFAREHTSGPVTFTVGKDLDWEQLRGTRLRRHGAELTDEYCATKNQDERWLAARERVNDIESGKPRVQWNLWLSAAGRIRTALSAFQEHSVKVDKKEAARLNALNGKSPMELVLQRNQRDELLHVAENRGSTPWRVQPDLLAAVHAAITSYHSARAPLYPLSEIKRLGYLDEMDSIECQKDLLHPDARLAFRLGTKYPIRTQTVTVTRTKFKPNAFTGDTEELQFTGQELAIYLLSTEIIPAKLKKDEEPGTEFCFMDSTIKKDKNTVVGTAKKVKGAELDIPNSQPGTDGNGIDFTLQQLCEHFTIPDVQDVASANPQGYESNLKFLEELEQLCPA